MRREFDMIRYNDVANAIISLIKSFGLEKSCRGQRWELMGIGGIFRRSDARVDWSEKEAVMVDAVAVFGGFVEGP